MIIGKLAAIGVAALLACGAAWGQGRPNYEEALAAVTAAGCERSEADRYVRFFCEEGEALWYFTHEGRPEHSAYFVAPAYQSFPDRFAIVPREHMDFGTPITGGGRISASSRDEAMKLAKARSAWMKEIFALWRADVVRMQPKPKRDRGKLYPLEPS